MQWDGAKVISGPMDELICTVGSREDGPIPTEQTRANALLIAAAPETARERDELKGIRDRAYAYLLGYMPRAHRDTHFGQSLLASMRESQEHEAACKELGRDDEKEHGLIPSDKINAELLEALRFAESTLIEAVEKWSNGEDCYQMALDKCKQAIAKATEGQKG